MTSRLFRFMVAGLGAGWLALSVPAADAPRPRQYLPERVVDVEHLALDITPDFRHRTIAGDAWLRFRVLLEPLRTLRLDAVELRITNVTASVAPSDWEVTDDALRVFFDPPLPPGSQGWVRVRYSAEPKRGLYFRTPEMGYPATDEHLWTQGESTTSRHWFPGYDALGDKLTSEITCRVPPGMVVLANGRKTAETLTNRLLAVTWLQDKPHANYLVTLVAGQFTKLEDRHRDVPLTCWTLPSDATNAAAGVAGTRDMMAFFEQLTGTPYPWPKYDQVWVEDFVAGGMENTSLTVLRNDALFAPGFEELRSTQGLVAHELSHQWFGDLVTCKDWSQLWLNEGFATYAEELYGEHHDGVDEFRYRMHESRRDMAESPNDTRPIVWRGYADPDDMFDGHAYGRAGWMLHMVRSQLGMELFRQVLRTYLEKHAYGNVVSGDFQAVLEQVTGRSFDQFFDQWFFHGGRPDLEINYSWDEATKIARVSVRQLQPVNDQVLLFNVPLPLRFKLADGVVDRVARVTRVSEDFFFPLPQRPQIVRVDPEVTLFAKLRFSPPSAMIVAQVADLTDTQGRIEAAQQLAARRDQEAVKLLKARLNEDPFRGVRCVAADGLRAIHNDEALAALLVSLKQPDARVRRQVVEGLAAFSQDSARQALLGIIREEKNPDILAVAMGGIEAWRTPEVREQLLKLVATPSYQGVLASAALRALRRQDDPAMLEPVLALVRTNETTWPPGALHTGLDTIARLAREQQDRTAIREYLTRFTSSQQRGTRRAAIDALGALEDPHALLTLEKFTVSAKDSPDRQAAERAISTIRGARKAPAELGALRDELREVKDQNRNLQTSLDELRKKVEALAAPPAKPAKSRKP